MLKERTNRWARLKLLLAVPVMAGALYAFAQPEVNETLIPGLAENLQVEQQKTMDYQTLLDLLHKEETNYYTRHNQTLARQCRESQVHQLLMNRRNEMLFDNERVTKETLKAAIRSKLPQKQRETNKKYNRLEEQIILFGYDTGADVGEFTQAL